MENASKALLMAGGILIALLVIGALLLMFNQLSSYQKTNSDVEKQSQLVEFNNPSSKEKPTYLKINKGSAMASQVAIYFKGSVPSGSTISMNYKAGRTTSRWYLDIQLCESNYFSVLNYQGLAAGDDLNYTYVTTKDLPSGFSIGISRSPGSGSSQYWSEIYIYDIFLNGKKIL